MKSAALALLFLAGSVSPAFADYLFTVNSTRDARDLTRNGRCETGMTLPDGAPECTLRAAIMEASFVYAIPRLYRITLPAGTFLIELTDTDAATEEFEQERGAMPSHFASRHGDFDINAPVQIVGAGPGVTIIDGGANDRIFDVWAETERYGKSGFRN